jgi:hypothetical protein
MPASKDRRVDIACGRIFTDISWEQMSGVASQYAEVVGEGVLGTGS